MYYRIYKKKKVKSYSEKLLEKKKNWKNCGKKHFKDKIEEKLKEVKQF